MQKRKGALIFLVISLVFAAGAGLVVLNLNNRFNEAVTLPVAAVDIPPYTVITADLYKMQDVPEASVPKDAVLNMKEIEGKYTRETIYAGEPIREARLARISGSAAVLTAKLTSLGNPDLRAFALPYTPDSAAGGKVVPGDRVDIVASVRMDSQSGTVGFGKVIGANVLVLDVSQPSQGKGSLILALMPSQIEDIAFALSSGTISFALNPYNTNVQAAMTTGVTGQDWLARHGYGSASPAPGK